MSNGKRFQISPVASSVPFNNSTNGFVATDVQSAIEETQTQALAARFTIVLQHNGSISNGTFIGYDSLISGDDTPILIPRQSLLLEYTFSNSNSGADYTIKLRKNSTVATIFNTVSKVDTRYFVQTNINQSFSAGDRIYIEYQDDGINASDGVIVLFFRSVI